MDSSRLDVGSESATQQPRWADPLRVARAREELAARPALVTGTDVRRLRTALARVAAGEAHIVQAGDCAEDPAECTGWDVARKRAVIDLLSGTLAMITHKPVVRVGRIAGQFAKPRSKPTERVGGTELPVFRGHLVNSPEPDPGGRQPDPQRMLTCYDAARDAMYHLGWGTLAPPHIDRSVWTSHEALLLDYEVPLVRRDAAGRPVLTTTHWPWIGCRTADPEGPHVSLLARTINPVACKIGPGMTVDTVLALCRRLDPDRQPGRLTLIARMGATHVAHRLPALVTAVRRAGHPVSWLTDPMHGNTVTTPEGLKTRYVGTIVHEVEEFLRVVRTAGGTAGGIHLETTPDAVTECVPDESQIAHVGDKYTSLCDPRLNPRQAVTVVSAWRR